MKKRGVNNFDEKANVHVSHDAMKVYLKNKTKLFTT
jgi:hypothetical protein